MVAVAPVDASEEIRSLVAGWFRASQDNDDDWFYANARPEFVYQMGDGAIAGLDVIVPFSHRITGKRYELLELDARRYGDTILAYGRYSGRGVLPPDAGSREHAAKYARGVIVRFAQVWVDGEDGQPKIIFLQSTTIA